MSETMVYVAVLLVAILMLMISAYKLGQLFERKRSEAELAVLNARLADLLTRTRHASAAAQV